MKVVRYYRYPGCSAAGLEKLLGKLQKAAGDKFQICSVETEICIYVQLNKELSQNAQRQLEWIINTPFQDQNLLVESFLEKRKRADGIILEFGPRLNFSTAFSTNAVSICRSAGFDVDRIEQSMRYLISLSGHGIVDSANSNFAKELLAPALHDRMTECQYERPLETFELDMKSEQVYEINVLGEGRAALLKVNNELGLAFDDWDVDYYTDLFVTKIGRNPTSVECFDLAQSNSEHCRHWFFRGRMVIDGVESSESLLKMVMNTQTHSNQNNVIKFSDNSSAIKGYKVNMLNPVNPVSATAFEQRDDERHIIFTAETHNFPTGVAPFPGATTGTGGRIRDVQATGRGAHVIAGTAGYSFGNLYIPDYDLPWEDKSFKYPTNLSRPLDIAIEASNGASDYGNKFGEPILAGFARSFGLVLPGNGERREWIKPIMFTGGIGSLSGDHIQKQEAQLGMEVVKVGGPVYRIGVGGGAASSVGVQGDNRMELDFGAVQRGDPEMEQKMNRVIRACIELRDKNIICSIHDQGAGGNGNVLKEICYPAGALIRLSEFQLGDPTLSVLEVWGAEYQESNALLVRAEDGTTLKKIALREKCPVSFVGSITGDGKIRLVDDNDVSNNEESHTKRQKLDAKTYPVNLDLEMVLGDMPRKVFKYEHPSMSLSMISLPDDVVVRTVLDRVLRLPSVASKRYLTNKVDRSVTGLVAQQQCVGPLHTPLADVAVVALSHFDNVGGATAIGEQPIKGLVDASCGARMSVAEALTNLVFARITSLKDVKCSANWMWPAKLPGEGALLHDACSAMCNVMKRLGIAVDGGKDSLSMTTRLGDDVVKAPGCLVVSAYAPCPDVTATVTPDLKCGGGTGVLLHVDLSPNKHRLGGSALAQCYQQLGNSAPDLDSPDSFAAAFNVTQQLIQDGHLLSGHDVSDGGFLTCLLEMAFAGNCCADVEFSASDTISPIDVLFAEELGLILEVLTDDIAKSVIDAYAKHGIVCKQIGRCRKLQLSGNISVKINGTTVLEESMTALRDVWEETSFQLERLQTNPHSVEAEQTGLKSRHAPPYHVSFDPNVALRQNVTVNGAKPKVAVIREEGSNGDREMAAALVMAGFEVWDVNMQDLSCGDVSLTDFRGVVFVGGFSYADVFGSAKGWAAALRFNDHVRCEFDDFRRRDDTFSLGVCNGCQLMALLGWVGVDEDNKENGDFQGVLLTHNESERFESRFVTVRVEDSPSIMLSGMQDSVLGVWVAHGEGRMVFKNADILSCVHRDRLAPLRYTDDDGQPTTTYPLNPNGSPGGIAALCSVDGRHLAMMPHPERCVRMWQWPWMPHDWKGTVSSSPWLRMFENAFSWCSAVDLMQ